MLLENFMTSNVIFARQAIFSILYTGKSLGKQDHHGLRHNDVVDCLHLERQYRPMP